MTSVRRLAVALAVTATLTGGLLGCSGEDSPEQPARAVSSAHDTATVSGDTADLVDPVGAIDALEKVTCAADAASVWSGRGTLTNEEGVTRRYLVKFAIVRKKTSEVLGSKQKELTLQAGESAVVRFPELYRGRAGKQLVCVPRVVSGGA